MMLRIGLRIRFLRVAWIALLCAFFSGCAVVPMRVPAKTRNVSGELGKKLDLDFIQVGTTTRAEVGQKLGWIDTGVRDDRFFLGRWADSSWGVAWAAGGYCCAAVGGWNRAWTTHNLVLDFDEKGVVQQMCFVPDKDILRTLYERVSKDSSRSLDLSAPIEVPVEYIHSTGKHFLGRLILGKDTFQFLEDRETGAKESYDFKTSPENMSHLSMGHLSMGDWVNSLHPGNVVVTIHFRHRTSVGSKLNVRVDLPTTMILSEYITQIQPGSALHSDFQSVKGVNLFFRGGLPEVSHS